MFNPLHLQTLRAVLQMGSFSGAAKKLGYTTSAVSQQIAALERELGVVLFERRPQHLVTTPAAHQMGEYATELLSRMTEVKQDMSAFAAGSRGRLSIAAFPTAAAQLLPAALARLVRDHPEADITVAEGDLGYLTHAVQNADADLALVYEYHLVPHAWPAGLRRRLILDEELVVLIGAEHPLGRSTDVDLGAFHDQRWVGNPSDTPGFENLQRACAAHGFQPRVMFRSSDYDVVRGIVRAGLGVALVPALALGVDRTIKMRRLNGLPLRRRVFLMQRATNPNPLLGPAINACRDAAAQFVDWTATAFAEPLDRPLATTGSREQRRPRAAQAEHHVS